ncbi:MAG TPA: hypothetical protein PKK23_06390 [Nitrospirales bacterium]|nr:hypothetical protein [Nitrospirales bacterium]
MRNSSELRGHGRSVRGKKELRDDGIGFPEGNSPVIVPKVPHRFLIKRQVPIRNLIVRPQSESGTL